MKRFEISIIVGGISLLSSSLMPYRTLLTSCDDMNIFLVPLYQPHAGKTGKQLWLDFKLTLNGVRGLGS